MPIQRRHAASSAGVAVPSRTRRLMTCIFASYFAFRSSFAFASSASSTFLRAASSSSILTSSRAAFARKRSVEVSTPATARAGGATDGTPAETRAAASSLSCGSAPTDSGAGRVAPVPVGRRASRGPLPLAPRAAPPPSSSVQSCGGGVVVVVVVVVQMIEATACLSMRVPAVVAEHLGVRLPASPPPWASTSRWTEAEKCCKTAANYPSSPALSTMHSCNCANLSLWRLKCPLTQAMN